jgi:hypothetical protein
MDTNLDTLLKERGKRYGDFEGNALCSQRLKALFFAHKARLDMDADQTEALEMIAHKLGRILNGDHNYADSWRDIAGYAQLVADRLDREQSTTTTPPQSNV